MILIFNKLILLKYLNNIFVVIKIFLKIFGNEKINKFNNINFLKKF